MLPADHFQLHLRIASSLTNFGVSDCLLAVGERAVRPQTFPMAHCRATGMSVMESHAPQLEEIS